MKVTIILDNPGLHEKDTGYYGRRLERIEISDNCPKCGGKRGKPYQERHCHDGVSYMVDRWENECGHLDLYPDCWVEHLKIKYGK